MMTADAQRAVVARIAKLLRLSRGTDHSAEAAAALAKAAKLAAEAGLALDGIDADSAEPRITHEAGGVRRRSHSRKLCHHVLRRHFSVDVIGSYDDGAIYIGPAINIALAKHIETYLVRQCSAAWNEFFHAAVRYNPRNGGMRRAYEIGFYSAIDHTLASHPIRNDSPAMTAAIERYTAEHFNLKSSSMPPFDRRHAAAMVAGLERGYATPCSRPVSGAAPATMLSEVHEEKGVPTCA